MELDRGLGLTEVHIETGNSSTEMAAHAVRHALSVERTDRDQSSAGEIIHRIGIEIFPRFMVLLRTAKS